MVSGNPSIKPSNLAIRSRSPLISPRKSFDCDSICAMSCLMSCRRPRLPIRSIPAKATARGSEGGLVPFPPMTSFFCVRRVGHVGCSSQATMACRLTQTHPIMCDPNVRYLSGSGRWRPPADDAKTRPSAGSQPSRTVSARRSGTGRPRRRLSTTRRVRYQLPGTAFPDAEEFLDGGAVQVGGVDVVEDVQNF